MHSFITLIFAKIHSIWSQLMKASCNFFFYFMILIKSATWFLKEKFIKLKLMFWVKAKKKMRLLKSNKTCSIKLHIVKESGFFYVMSFVEQVCESWPNITESHTKQLWRKVEAILNLNIWGTNKIIDFL